MIGTIDTTPTRREHNEGWRAARPSTKRVVKVDRSTSTSKHFPAVMIEMDIGSQLTIRPGVPDDWQVIADFNTRLAIETEDKTLASETIAAGVRTLLGNPAHGRYFVACCDSRIIGQLMHTREWSDWRNGEIWWLQSVYVHPEHRRNGVFRALYRSLEQLAEQTPEVIGLRLYVEQHNAEALNAYRSLGLAEAGYAVMERIFRSVI
jgi:GNAT superfamily N-acetyltransferase